MIKQETKPLNNGVRVKKFSAMVILLAMVASAKVGLSRPRTSSPSRPSFSPPARQSPPKASPVFSAPKVATPRPTATKMFAAPPARVTPVVTPVRPAPQIVAPVKPAPVVVPTPVKTGVSIGSAKAQVTPVQTAQVRSSVPVPPRYTYPHRPYSRRPDWYRSDYLYSFRDTRYNTGYRYYPVYCERNGMDLLTGAMAGALLTYMIMENGARAPVYAVGDGTAYANVGNTNVPMIQDANGNWVQIEPQAQPAYQPQAQYNTQQVVVVKPTPKPAPEPSKPWGWIHYTILFGVLGGLGFLGYRYWVYRSMTH